MLVLDNIRSLGNVGGLFRTADAFRAQGLYLCGFTGVPPHRDIHRSALGAEQSVPWQHHPSTDVCLTGLRAAGYQCLAIELTDVATPLHQMMSIARRPLALVLGNEMTGVSPQALALCDGAIVIPQGGVKHSLNVAIAGSLALWEVYRAWGL